MNHKYISNVLKIMVIIMAILGLGLYLFVIPTFGKTLLKAGEIANNNLTIIWDIIHILTCVPCYYVLIRVWQVANNFEKNAIFVKENVKHFKAIYSSTMIDVCYFVLVTVVLFAVNIDRNLIMLILKATICFIGIAFAFVVRVIAEMIDKAAELQEENDLTI